MPHRQFIDSVGATWDVWDVHPTVASQTLANLCWQPAGQTDDGRNPVAPALADGWLCFESGGERRRLAPIPLGWCAYSAAQLQDLRDSAARVPTLDERSRAIEETRSLRR
jgi:hypothetical protein